MALTLSGTNGVVGAGFTVDASGVSVTAGVGTFSSIGAGASVPAAGLTGALPTISAANCTNIPAANLTGTLGALNGAALTGISTITVADQWRLHTTATGGGSSSNVDLFNWERVDTTPQGYIGTPVTLSNSPTTGVFSFPTTGVYRVSGFSMFSDNGSNMHYARFSMFATSNNSAYNTIAEGYASSLTTTQGFQTAYMESLIYVTDTSNVKVKFGFSGLYDVSCYGETTANRTVVSFTRLGATV